MTNSLEEFTQQYDLLIPLDNTNIAILCELFKKEYYPDEGGLYLIIYLDPNYDAVKVIVNNFDGLLEDFIFSPSYYDKFKQVIISAEHIEKAAALMSIDVTHDKIISDMIVPLIKDSLVQSYSEWFYET